MPKFLEKIISGGQTGVDRAALEVGLALGIPVGGFCPKGRAAEDGPIDEKYPLVETESDDVSVRTEQNVLAADATLVLSPGMLSGGTKLTVDLCEKHGRPCLVMEIARHHKVPLIVEWLSRVQPKVLNIAGPKESLCEGIQAAAASILKQVLSVLV